MATIDYIEDWTARLRGRLYTQFRSKVTWEKWVQLLGRQCQDLEDAGQTLLTLLSIEDSEGVQLDNIGRIVGQPRLGVDDATYRLYLSARILANKSSGTVEDIFSIMRALFGQDEARPLYEGGWVKEFVIRVRAALTRNEALIGTGFLGDAKEAGARGIFEWQERADTEMFAFTGAQLVGAFGEGVSSGVDYNEIVVTSTAGYPSSGTLRIDAQESYVYTSITPTIFVAPLNYTMLYDHPRGAGITVVGFTGAGLGFDQGHFAGAKQA